MLRNGSVGNQGAAIDVAFKVSGVDMVDPVRE
jgi:hypothetical protein